MFQPERRVGKSSYPDTPLNLSNMFLYSNKTTFDSKLPHKHYLYLAQSQVSYG